MSRRDITSDYFHSVVTKLNCEDVAILIILMERNAISHFKSIGNQSVFELSSLTEAKYRRTINRLNALDFVQTSHIGKERLLFLTQYGEAAFAMFMSKAQESEVI